MGNDLKVSVDSRSNWICLGLLCLFLYALFPHLIERGFEGWPNRGDSKFYAQCTEHYFKYSEFRWFEIYPIALIKGQGVDMVWLASLTPYFSSLWMSLLSLTAQEAVVYNSAFFFLGAMLLLFLCMKVYMGPYYALLLMPLYLLLTHFYKYGSWGATESVSQFFILLAICLMIHYEQEKSKVILFVLLIVLFLGCLVRPQNQFLLIASPLWFIFTTENGLKQKLFAGLLPVITLIMYFIFQSLRVSEGQLTFPYSFSFLVATEDYPHHQIFREYFGQFSLSDVWARSDLLLGKIETGIYILKQYWDEWIPALCLYIVVLVKGRHKSIALVLFLVLLASLFFSATGHLVPRYWRLFEPFTLLLLVLELHILFEKFISVHSRFYLSSLFLLSFYMLFQIKGYLGLTPYSEDLKLQGMPKQMISYLPKEGLVSSNHPAGIIDSLDRKVLLCPERLEAVKQINQEVENISAFVFTPRLNLKTSEYQSWFKKQDELASLGYRKIYDEDGWVLWINRSPTF